MKPRRIGYVPKRYDRVGVVDKFSNRVLMLGEIVSYQPRYLIVVNEADGTEYTFNSMDVYLLPDFRLHTLVDR